MRAIRYAEAHDLVGRNVAALVDPPHGAVGRPSRSLTLEQSLGLLEAARESRLNAYVVLSLTVGIPTEEARELRWDHVDLDGDPNAIRADWERTTRQQRQLAIAADAELRRRHPGQHHPPLRSPNPGPPLKNNATSSF